MNEKRKKVKERKKERDICTYGDRYIDRYIDKYIDMTRWW